MKTKKRTKYYKFYPTLIFISILFMSIGYATINSIVLSVEGNATAQIQTGIYITDVQYSSGTNINPDDSEILQAFGTNLKSSIKLSSSTSDTEITYKITLLNSSSETLRFDEVKYLVGTDTYSNTNITFELIDLKKNDIVNAGSYITFYIKFYYLNNKLASNSILKSQLNFNFVDIEVWNLGQVNGVYNIDMNATHVDNYQNLTENNFFFEPTAIPVPGVTKGDMFFTKNYDPTTGIFTYSRTQLNEDSPIEVKGTIYVTSKNVVLLSSTNGSYSITVDCKSVPDYANKTANDFIVDLKQIYYPSKVSGTMYFSKTYSQSTGKLTLKRSSISGSGLIIWYVDVYYLE